MEHGFPPDAPWHATSLIVLFAPGFLGLLAAISVVALFINNDQRPAKESKMILWAVIFLLTPTIVLVATRAFSEWEWEHVGHVVFIYVPIVWLICFIGIQTDGRRLRRSGLGSKVPMSLVCLIGFGILFYSSLPRHSVSEAARRSQCRNNLKQVGLAMHKFEKQYDSLPDASSGEPPVSWRIQLLPFTDQKTLFESYDQSLSWDHSKNDQIAQKQTWSYHCPSRHEPYFDGKRRYYTDYVRITGPGTSGESGRSMRSSDFTDGASQTCVVVEASGLNIVWTEPRDADVSRQPIGINLTGQGKWDSPGWISSFHAGGGHLLKGDGSARFINENIDPKILKALTTRDAGDRIDLGF